MSTKPTTPDEYLDSIPDDRRASISAIRDAINKNLPAGFTECIAYGMIGWVVPKETYLAGYHCDPSKPLMLMSLGNNKRGISLHHLGLYGNAELLDWFREAWKAASSHKLDMGKGCVRFKKPNEIPVGVIGELASKLSPQEWITWYEKAINRRK